MTEANEIKKGCGKDFYYKENPKQKLVCGTDYLCDDCRRQGKQDRLHTPKRRLGNCVKCGGDENLLFHHSDEKYIYQICMNCLTRQHAPNLDLLKERLKQNIKLNNDRKDNMQKIDTINFIIDATFESYAKQDGEEK